MSITHYTQEETDESSSRFFESSLSLILHLADISALCGVDKVPRGEVEDEGVELEPHEDGEGQEGSATNQLHVVKLLPELSTHRF